MQKIFYRICLDKIEESKGGSDTEVVEVTTVLDNTMVVENTKVVKQDYLGMNSAPLIKQLS